MRIVVMQQYSFLYTACFKSIKSSEIYPSAERAINHDEINLAKCVANSIKEVVRIQYGSIKA